MAACFVTAGGRHACSCACEPFHFICSSSDALCVATDGLRSAARRPMTGLLRRHDMDAAALARLRPCQCSNQMESQHEQCRSNTDVKPAEGRSPTSVAVAVSGAMLHGASTAPPRLELTAKTTVRQFASQAIYQGLVALRKLLPMGDPIHRLIVGGGTAAESYVLKREFTEFGIGFFSFSFPTAPLRRVRTHLRDLRLSRRRDSPLSTASAAHHIEVHLIEHTDCWEECMPRAMETASVSSPWHARFDELSS